MVSVADALAAGHDQIPNYRPPLTRDRDRIDAMPPSNSRPPRTPWEPSELKGSFYNGEEARHIPSANKLASTITQVKPMSRCKVFHRRSGYAGRTVNLVRRCCCTNWAFLT
jgi:hypothetical protein